MDRDAFHKLLRDPYTKVKLDRWTAEDREERERATREGNEEIVTRFLRNWFKMTEPKK